jgi:hypothetical protein
VPTRSRWDAAGGWEHPEQPDDLVPREQRHRDRGLDPRLGRRVGDARQTLIRGDVVDDEHPTRAKRAEREIEQPLGQPRVRAGEPESRGCVQAVVLA